MESFSEILATDAGSLEEASTISFYPNPAKDRITVSGTFNLSILLIYNSNGQLVKATRQSEEIDISELPSGLYFAKAIEGEEIRSGKFMKR